jgi:hypothetical protein
MAARCDYPISRWGITHPGGADSAIGPSAASGSVDVPGAQNIAPLVTGIWPHGLVGREPVPYRGKDRRPRVSSGFAAA